MWKMHYFLIAMGLLSSPFSDAASPRPEPIRAWIYAADSGRQKPLFRYLRSEAADESGVVKAQASFSEPEGGIVYAETSESKDGRILRYQWHHHQLKELGTVEVRGTKVHYSVTKNGVTESRMSDAPENLVIGPTLISYLQKHWKDLSSKSGVPVRIGVPDRMEDYGFRFTRDQGENVNSQEFSNLTLKPTSIFVSLVVSPITFVFTKDGSKLLVMKGKSLLKVKKNGKWDDLIAETVFDE